jgi:hypothetical protein
MATPAFAIICHHPIYCPDTDGYMGEGKYVIERHLTKAKAEARARILEEEAGGEINCHVEIKPYKNGEEKRRQPLHSLIELATDAAAWKDACLPM